MPLSESIPLSTWWAVNKVSLCFQGSPAGVFVHTVCTIVCDVRCYDLGMLLDHVHSAQRLCVRGCVCVPFPVQSCVVVCWLLTYPFRRAYGMQGIWQNFFSTFEAFWDAFRHGTEDSGVVDGLHLLQRRRASPLYTTTCPFLETRFPRDGTGRRDLSDHANHGSVSYSERTLLHSFATQRGRRTKVYSPCAGSPLPPRGPLQC